MDKTKEYLKNAVSTQTKIKVVRAIESGIRQQIIADTMGLSLEEVRKIRSGTKADIKAVTAFLATASPSQKKMMAHAVRSCGGNELSSRRGSLGVSRRTLRQWILAAEMGLLGEYCPAVLIRSTAKMRKGKSPASGRVRLLKKRRDRGPDGTGTCRKAWVAEVIVVRDLIPEYALGVLHEEEHMLYRLAHLEMSEGELNLQRSIINIFRENFECYGHRKITKELEKQGTKVDKKTVAKIMKEEGFRCKYRPKKNKIERSMSNKGNCYDNSVIECFFGNLKTEIGDLGQSKTVQD